MTNKSLNSLLKEEGLLSTDLGEFEYVKALGEGGNSFVFQFRKAGMNFAIKFLKPSESGKLKRFKDEYFCGTQIPSHENVVQAYHFDSVRVSGEAYFIIIMKHYHEALSSQGPITSEDEAKRIEKAWRLFLNLAHALGHLHMHGIIHRDVKPQNIFFSNEEDNYVLGDLGIAHFSDGKFPKESKTSPSDRLANFSFSAPEQLDSRAKVTQASDIYSMGQVLQWYMTGSTIRGLGRASLANESSPKKLKWIDLIIDRCLRNDPANRFQSIEEISEYLKALNKPPKKDLWKALDEFDDVICRSFPNIRKNICISDVKLIERFISNFQEQCNFDDFWYMTLEGGNNVLRALEKIDDSKWLIFGDTEISIQKIIVYRDSNYPYKNFLIILTSPSSPFETVDPNGTPLKRDLRPDQEIDAALLWKGRYIAENEARNGYYECAEGVIPVTREDFKARLRYLKEYAYIIIPEGTASAVMSDWEPTEKLLESALQNGHLDEAALKKYLDETRQHHSREITMYN